MAPVPAKGPSRGLVIGLVVLILLLIGGVALLVTRNGRTTVSAGSHARSSSAGRSSTTTTITSATTTTVDPQAVIGLQNAAVLRGELMKMENLLDQSSQGRGQVSSLVQRAQACEVDPQVAAQTIDGVITNRQSLLTQLAALNTGSDPTFSNLVVLLQRAMGSSVDADQHYADWMNYLYQDAYYSEDGCTGQAPTDADFDAAQSASTEASNEKQDFVSAYNPLAQQSGLRTWQGSAI